MAAADPQAFFLTPPPRHLAELRIDTAPSAVAFSAPCGAAKKGAGRKRRCLVPGSSVRKRMLLELVPFGVAPAPSSTPPPSPSPPPSPVVSRAGAPPPSPAGEFSFATVLRVVPPASPGNIFKFVGTNAATTPAGSDARMSASLVLTPLGQAAKPAAGAFSFLELPKTSTATGPTANGGFVFAAPSEGPLTPTSTNTSGGLSFLASPKQSLTPMGSTASGGGGFLPSLTSLKPARTGLNVTGDFAFPSPGPACSQIGSAPSAAAKEPTQLARLATPPSAFTASPSPPPPMPNSGDGSHKRPSLFLRRAATCERRKRLRQLEEQQQRFTPPPQEIAKTNSLATGEAVPSSIMSGLSTGPCCTFFTSPSKEAARQEARKAFSEASQSPAGSHCSSPTTPEKANKQEREVEVSSSPRERGPTSPAVVCPGAEVVVRVTCKCGVHKEFCFDHHL